MNTRIIKTLVKKEMLDVFRDKKTVLMMLVVPILLYPLIFLGAMQAMVLISSSMEKQNFNIAVEAADDGAFLQKLKESTDDTNTITIVDAGKIDDYETALDEEEIDIYIAGYKQDDTMQYDVYYLSSAANSSHAINIVMDVFEELQEELTKEKILQAGLDVHEILEPITYEEKDIATSEQSIGSLMGSILPFMLIISLLMGTMYPAIDTTAGERERGTLETILTLPVTNRQLIVSKFLTVAVIGMISALLNMLSMGGIAFYMYQIKDLQTETQGFDFASFLPAIFICILTIFAFSFFISALTMCVTAFAKSYKEANNYITPLMLVVMFVGYIGFIPNIELTQTAAMIPVANICLLIKNLLAFKVDYAIIAIVMFSNIAYAILAILFLSKIYDSEAILFGDSKGGLQFLEKRSNLKKGGVPSMADTWLVIALTTVLFLYAGSMLQLRFGLAGVFGTQLILLLVPLLVVLYTKKDIKMTYAFRKTGASNFFSALLLIGGVYFLNLVISSLLCKLFPASTETVTTTFNEIMDGNPIAVLFVIALAPAVCEEMLFRGVILHSMQQKYKAISAMVATAVIFGLYHMSVVKFIPTGLMGFCLCYVVYKTGSIFPAMLMHFVNNAVSVVLVCFQEQLEGIVPVFYKDTLSILDSLLFLGLGIILVAIGKLLLDKQSKKAGASV